MVPNWKDLRHAYGSAEDLPAILAELEPDPTAPAWGELWGRVCHQGTTYSASVYVLPFLLSAASDWGPVGRVMPLFLSGAIVLGRESVLTGREALVEALRSLALETVKAGELSRSDRIYVMQSVLALGGEQVWGRVLDHLNDGEFPGQCPFCRTDLYFAIGQYGFFCAAGEWVRNPETPRTEITPRLAEELVGVGLWLNAVCVDSGDPTLAKWICYLFGVSTCPNCHQQVDVPFAITELEKSMVDQTRP